MTPAGASPAWDRFAAWPPFAARLALLALAIALIAGALVPIEARKAAAGTASLDDALTRSGSAGPDSARPDSATRPRDNDLALYDRVIARIGKGGNYYDFIVTEHRRSSYPVIPGLAVRLPTLAYIEAYVGEPGQIAAAALLMLATLLAWWRRLGTEPGGADRRLLAMALLFVGVSLGLTRYFFVLHELWAGMLLALSFGLHRSPDADGNGGRWLASLLVAALALAIREHALPFVALMAATAFWRRDWRQGLAWSALVAVFLTALAVHLHLIAAQVIPGDRASPSWLAWRGLSGWLSNLTLSSNLRLLPHWLAGPLVIAAMLGWIGWRSPAGRFGSLLYLGYGFAFMIAGRPENYYWGWLVAPAMLMGLAFAPAALTSLLAAAFQRHCPDTPPAAEG